MQALSSALSLLGNRHESERSLTKSAISENIRIETQTPENLSALSRDTQNANEQVNKQDLQKVQERQEMAQVIGEISNNAISLATYNEREKINRLELEKFQAAEKLGDKRHTDEGKQILAGYDARINQIQENIDRTYGIGSPNGMAIRAVTAALQAAAQNDTNGTIVALASPYLNQQIHEMTKGDTAKDKATNLIAHALLSAIEFQVTGKDPLTGAVAGVTGEVTAEIIAQKLYEKSPKELTASEKENISTLSQLAGGLAGALTAKVNGSTKQQGGSFLTATAGAETAKRAVEHNFLSTLSQDRRDVLEKKIKEGNASQKEIMEFISYEQDDHTSDYLADKARNHPEKMTDDEWSRLDGYLQRYVSESLRSGETPDEINRSLKEIVSGNYIKGYGYAYGLDDKYRSDLPSRWTTKDRTDKEIFYQELYAKHIQNLNTIENSFDVKAQRSTAEAALLLGTGGGSLLVKGVSKLEKVADQAFVSAIKAENQLNKTLPVVNDALNKAYVNGQLTYADIVGKGVNGARGYVRNTVKTMGEQKTEIVLANALAAGMAKSGSESYDYIINGKEMNSDNLTKSGIDIFYSTATGGVTSGMPVLPAIGLGVTVDWAKDNGKYDVTKTTGSAIVGSASDSFFGRGVIAPVVREIMTNSFEKVYDSYNGVSQDEKK
ncbi:VENN motif pre-toxin domain-containing protein [Rodentibacter caecimuris]|uniref:VENN motif pre-toxin domain-containing protein n=1 Tax=Rodentibacter caecimuris TaxID=1796644 RepID=UPI002119C42A|nr:VENN motif pre-toxin domain-containing protein [Rodentibacter heylii]MCQ9124651.1 VENN motif pre-toxin domain-containing protein [Rodentibacter heylii]